MSTAVEIEQAFETLPPHEYAELLAWLDERRAGQVDASFEEAILSGKFEALAQKAMREVEAGEPGRSKTSCASRADSAFAVQ